MTSDRSRVFTIAHGKSGDKLDRANIGLVARSDEDFRRLATELTEDHVGEYLAPFMGNVIVRRYTVPTIRGLNFVIEGALDGGSLSSRRIDRLAKAVSGLLLAMPLEPSDAAPSGQTGSGST